MKAYCTDVAREVRLKSTCTTKVGAVLERGGRILSVACNTPGSASNGRWRYSRHAESNLLTNKDARGATAYVYRAHGITGAPLLARPCAVCYGRLAEAGVRRCYYTTPSGWEVINFP